MQEALKEILSKCTDGWFVMAMIAQACFASRFVLQWIISEKHQKSIIPVSFWYLSIIGSTGLLVYGFVRREPILILGQALNNIVYIRNLMLISKQNKLAVTEK